MQFCKVAETSENAAGPRSSVSLWRKYLDLYTVKLQAIVRMLLYCMKPPYMRMKPHNTSLLHILAHTTTFSSPSSVACVQLGTVTLNCHPWPAMVLIRTGCTRANGLQVLNKQHASFRTLHHNSWTSVYCRRVPRYGCWFTATRLNALRQVGRVQQRARAPAE